jgi:glycosyltransferase involved in cell wall biosynthesis
LHRNTHALFSICIPTFNRRDFLCQAIRSALRQTYANIEVVVSDNASTDGTKDAVTAFQDDRIRYFCNDYNLGGAANWERCAELAHGEICSWLQDDDLFLPGFVSAAVDSLASSEAVCCVAACLQTSTPASLAGASVFGSVMMLDWCNGSPVPLPLSLALPLAIFESTGIPPAMAFRTHALRRMLTDVCHTEYPLYAERMLIVRCATLGSVVMLPMIGGIYRSHPDQYSRAMLRQTSSAAKQYKSFVTALQEIKRHHHVSIDPFVAFLADAPDGVVEQFYLFANSIRLSLPYFDEVRSVVIREYKSRNLNTWNRRLWRVASDLTPALLARTFSGPIERLRRRLRL